jgi:hypothetical protein
MDTTKSSSNSKNGKRRSEERNEHGTDQPHHKEHHGAARAKAISEFRAQNKTNQLANNSRVGQARLPIG